MISLYSSTALPYFRTSAEPSSEGDGIVEFTHGIKLLFDGLSKFDLGAATVKIVFFPVDLEIYISGKIVRQSAYRSQV